MTTATPGRGGGGTHGPAGSRSRLGPDFGPAAVVLTDRVAVVTGAARGIGAATATALARFGAHVAVCDRDEEGLDATRDAVEAEGRRCVASVLDVRDADAVDTFLARAHTELGPLDICVNNAGGGFWAPFESVSPGGEAALVAENFTSVTSVIRLGLPRMAPGASIVNVTSVEAHHAAPGFAVYAAMKAAVTQLTWSLALELGDRGIRVNCVAPDMIPTPGDAGLAEASGALLEGLHPTPLRRMGTPEECAAVIVFLASDLAAFVTGSTVAVDGGTVAAGAWKVRLDGRFGL